MSKKQFAAVRPFDGAIMGLIWADDVTKFKGDGVAYREMDPPLAAYPQAPFADGIWSWGDSGPYWHDPRDLDQIKADKNAEINAARMAANRAGFMFAGKLISTDELSRSDIDGTNGTVTLTGEFPAAWPGAWKTDDNSYVAIPDVETWKAFYAAMTAQGSQNFATSQALKAQLALAEKPEQVAAVVWPA